MLASIVQSSHRQAHISISNTMDAVDLQRFDITKEEERVYRAAFEIFDRDEDGCITASELGAVIKEVGDKCDPDQLETMIADVDKNGNGTVEYEEFIQMMKKRSRLHQEQELMAAFKVFDKKKEGYIRRATLQHILIQIGEAASGEEVNKMIHDVDPHSDGRIYYQDFVKYLCGTA